MLIDDWDSCVALVSYIHSLLFPIENLFKFATYVCAGGQDVELLLDLK